ncbi:MAG: ATP-dependent DNA helicase RecG [Saprospiraceae bacterium]
MFEKPTVFLLDSPIEYLKGVGPARGELLKKELQVFTFRDLLFLFPFRYIDKTQFQRIVDLHASSGDVQVRGILRRIETLGEGSKKRLVAKLRDDSGSLDLVWFKGAQWVEKNLVIGAEYVVYGRIQEFNAGLSISHPEIEQVNEENSKKQVTFAPVYPSTEKLNNKGLDAKFRRKLIQDLLEKLTERDLPEMLPPNTLRKFNFPAHFDAIKQIHFPKDENQLLASRNRLKFEELFFMQLRLLHIKKKRKTEAKGFIFSKVGEYFNNFYQHHIPFELTNAQKKVLKEIRKDLGQGIQMNRLLQGDVGSGKTMVAFLTMLIALDNGFQACFMAPTEILAQQHYNGISAFAEKINVTVGYLSGNVKGKKRKEILDQLEKGTMQILIGTHALIEDPVIFNNLGLTIIDEQHRFGVEQRAKLWKKNPTGAPHILVMTATPIPRTLAMSLYGDLDISVIDELPPGRKEIITTHRTEAHRLRVFGFMKEEIAKGRQIYVVYPLIEESEKLDLNNLMEGYESLSRDFPKPDYQISIVHGKMKAQDKDYEMNRFIKKETNIMVATTVIEVGVNVPNASIMVIENTERFGLSQLHQLRGRVGRGAEQSFCILMTGYKLSAEGKERIKTMCETTDGFKIAETDLRLRGPGNIEGKQQSGMLNLKLADLSKDGNILHAARTEADQILESDQLLARPEHLALRKIMLQMDKQSKSWSRIS